MQLTMYVLYVLQVISCAASCDWYEKSSYHLLIQKIISSHTLTVVNFSLYPESYGSS